MKARARAAISAVSPQMAYLDVIRAVLPRDGFFCEEISQMGFTARFGFPVYAPRQYVTCGYQDNLGFGFNTALGVKVANPDKAVVSVSGDGGFLFGVQELATAVRYRIALVTIVFNNASYGNVRRDQIERYSGRFLGAELTNPDFVRLAESFGAMGIRRGESRRAEARARAGAGGRRAGGHRGERNAGRRVLALAVPAPGAASAVDRLHGRVFLQAFLAEFDADARALHAAERRVRLDRAVLVDPDRAALELRASVRAPARCPSTTPNRRGRSGCRWRARSLHRIVRIADDRQRRTELLLVDQRIAVVEVRRSG